ncbi:winged helix-turn-helix domain-containing protein [Vibrio crassostreae]|uniref:winged helix-turn-helix domain-containing protein n=1 Tax=Vibrio crassostreae TaxID=246167 RepID=UPI000FAA669B|nr:hypothetical protein [Vibrio crassostreae]ROO49998.1 transcriptional regulator [Vibrio crassostreae]
MESKIEVIQIGPFELNISQNATLKMPDGVGYVITLPEAYVLKRLQSDMGLLIPKKELELAGWGDVNSVGINSLAVAISNLRKILNLGGVKIVNEPKRGYKIVLNDVVISVSGMSATEKSNLASKHLGVGVEQFGSGDVIKIFLIAFFVSFSIIIIFYLSVSWVSVKCEPIFNNYVCYLASQEGELGKIKFNNDRKIYFASSEEYIEVSDVE